MTIDILKTLKEARETLEKVAHIGCSISWFVDTFKKIDAAIEVVEKAEPVAFTNAKSLQWLKEHPLGSVDTTLRMKGEIPLYLHPAAPAARILGEKK